MDMTFRRFPTTDPPRNETRVRMRVKPRQVAANVCGTRVRKNACDADGFAEVIVYESQVDRVLAMVETEFDAIRAAAESHTRKLRDHVCRATGIEPKQLPGDMAEWNADAKAAERTYTSSLESEFYSVKGRGIKPLLAAEVVERGLPPPLSEEAQATANLARELRKESSAIDPTVAAVIGKAVAEGVAAALREAGITPSRENRK